MRESGAQWTVVRASWFAQNFSEAPLLDGMRAGELVFPAGEVLEPFIDTRDIADVVVAVLGAADDRYAGQVVEVSGGRLLSFRDAVAEISAAAGREIRYVPVSAREYGGALTEYGVPHGGGGIPDRTLRDESRWAQRAPLRGVQRILGRAPRDFADFAREHAELGIWKA